LRKFLVSLLILTLLQGVANAVQIDFHVSVLGDGKLHPGDDTAITLLIENEGKADNFMLNENTSQLLQLVTTAKDLRVEIDDSWLPIEVKTVNPQLIGDLPSGRIAKAVFRVKVDEDAKLGEYSIPVRLKYTKVTYTMSGTNVILNYHEDEFDVDYLKIEIVKKDYDFSVKSVSSTLKTNQEGVVEVTIKNTGNNEIYDATLLINTTPPLQPNPKAMSAYLGNIGVDEEVKATFKVYVMEGALNNSYPATLVLKFKTSVGKPYKLTQSIGLGVEDEDAFLIIDAQSFITSPKTIPKQQQASIPSIPSLPMFMSQQQQSQQQQIKQIQSVITIPSRGFVLLSIKNVGKDVNDAVAILSFGNPLIQAENMPYIGYFRKNDVKDVLFYIKSTAPPGKYRGVVMLKYKNELGDDEMSKKHYIEVEIKSITPLKIEKVETENLAVGLKGNVNVILKNSLNKNVHNAMFLIISPDSSLTPLSSSSYLYEAKPEESGEIRFRLQVSDEAVSGSYKLYLVERYNLGDAEGLVSIAEFPVIIKPKMAYFEVLSIESNLYPDETGDVTIKIKNAGNLAIHNAVVKLELSSPLTIAGGSALSSLVGQSQPGLYFIGTLKPDEVAIAKFRVDVDKDAGAGNYPVTIKIDYYDDEGYLHTSNPIIASVEVKEKPLITLPIAIAILLALIAIILATRFVRKKRKQGNKDKQV